MQRIYLDTNVFISWIDKELGANYRPLFEEADAFFDWVKANDACLVLSNWFFEEAERVYYSASDAVIKTFTDAAIRIEVVIEKRRPAIGDFVRRGLHTADAIHAAIALKHKCDCIVTFNVKDFRKADDLIRSLQPNEFG